MLGTSKALTIGLYLNAAFLAAIVLVLWGKSDAPPLISAAYAQQQPQPIAGGAGLFVMPAQLAPQVWGCYVMDVDRQTLMVYQYDPGERFLRFRAARDFSNDRRLKNFNTDPSPEQVKNLADKADNNGRVQQP